MSNTPFEVPVDLRDFAQKSVEQARKAFEGFLGVAQKTADAMDTATHSVRSGTKSISSQTLSYAEQNVNAAFDHALKLVHAKDPQEAFALQSEYIKSQLANLQTQAKSIGTAIQSSVTPKSE